MELICGKKYSDLSHIDWVNYQLKCNLARRSLRNVLLHTSFIEAVLIDKSQDIIKLGEADREKGKKYRDIKIAIKILEDEELISYQGKSSTRESIFRDLFISRNDLIHGIVKLPGLDQGQIEKLRNEAHEKILQIYSSAFILKIFAEREYSLPSKEVISELSAAPGDT